MGDKFIAGDRIWYDEFNRHGTVIRQLYAGVLVRFDNRSGLERNPVLLFNSKFSQIDVIGEPNGRSDARSEEITREVPVEDANS